MSEYDNILIVAFDGLDENLVEEYNCENLKQSENGRINIRDFERFGTPWLWGSFLTGEKQNFRNVKKFKDARVDAVEDFFWRNSRLMTKWKGLRKKFLYKKLLRLEETSHTREDLDSGTFLDTLDFESFYVPAYNKYPNNEFAELASKTVDAVNPNKDYSKLDAFKSHRSFYLRCKEELLGYLENSTTKNCMFYFKYTDSVQHLLFNEDIEYAGNNYSIEEMYREIDKLAGEIKERSNHDLIMFVSDHGLSNGDHNENAFYSFSEGVGLFFPKITDFREKIEEIVKEK